MTPAQKVCADAADLIERCGWVQGKPGNQRDGFCAYGAICHQAHWRDAEDAAALLRSTLGKHGLTAWNDRPERTKAEVIAALRKASQSC